MRDKKIIAGLIVAALLFANGANAVSFNKDILDGAKNYAKEQFKDAFENFREAQIEEPDNEELKYNLGNSAYKTENYEQAERIFSSLANETTSTSLKQKSYYNLGNSFYRQGKLEQAEQAYKDALKIDSNDMQAKKNLERVQEELKKRQKQAQDRRNKQQTQKKDGHGKKDPDNKQEEKKNNPKEEPPQNQEKNSGSNQQPPRQNEGQKQEVPSQPGKELAEREAEKWLDSIKDYNKEVTRKNALKNAPQNYGSMKDW